ncbi:hypothetical protein B0H17DRAFT_892768, partial [Mycena rosella]
VTSVATSFKLNKEQKRAFKLATNHAIAEDPEPLRMYLGGVGGTEKSQVIKALIIFFEERGDSHRFTVLAPTGAAAALLNGSTYHSFLGISDSMDNERHEGIGIKKVSMVSCSAMYTISARLAMALN